MERSTPKSLIPVVIVLVITIIATTLVGAAWYYDRNGNSGKTEQVNTDTKDNTNEERTDFATYQNTAWGFSFQYPKEWSVIKDGLPKEIRTPNSPNEDLIIGQDLGENQTPRPSVILIMNPDGFGPVFPDLRYTIARSADGFEVTDEEIITTGANFEPGFYQIQATGTSDSQKFMMFFSVDDKDKEGWDVTVKEILSSFSFNEQQTMSKYLWFAIKEGNTVSVKRLDLSSGHENLEFTYNESRNASLSGNLWEGLPPSIALSHNGEMLAYISEGGIAIHNIRTSDVRSLVTKVADTPRNIENAPTWSFEELSWVYTMAYPRWSADDKYISFSNGYYEGSKIKIFDIDANKVINVLPQGTTSFGTSYRISWADTKDQYVIANGFGYQDPGLFIGNANSIGTPVDYSEFIQTDAAFLYADSSKDGGMVAITYKNSFENAETKVAVLDVQNKISKVLSNIEWSKPFFGDDNVNLYYIDSSDGNKLVQYDFSDNTVTKTLELSGDYTRWEKIGLTPGGYIELWGSVAENDLTVASNTNQLLVVNPDDLSVVYQSKVYKGFTTFLGFTD